MKATFFLALFLLTFQSYAANSLLRPHFGKPEMKVYNDPIALTLQPLQYCDPNNDGFGVFDLSSLNELILMNQGDANTVNYNIAYFETATDANTGTGPTLSSPYTNSNPWTQTIYYRVTNIATNAYAVGTFQLIVNPKPEATIPADYHLCDYSGAIGMENFDLSTVIPQVLGAGINPAIASVYFFTDSNLTNPILTITGFTNTIPWNQTLYVQIMDNATGCYDVVPLQLYVDPLPITVQPNYPQYSLCDLSGPTGYETFDLTSQISNILVGQTGMSVTFYPSYSAAITGVNLITNPSAYVNSPIYVQTLGIRVTNNVTGCYSVSTMDIRVEPLPQLIPPAAPYTICDSNQDGVAFFDLTTLIPMIDQGGLYNISFHETWADATLDATHIPNPHYYSNINPFVTTLYVRGEDPVTGCFSIITVQLVVNPSPVLPTLPSLVQCDQDSDPQNGSTLFDLTVQPLNDADFNLTYYTSQSNAESSTGAILNPNAFEGTNGQTIWYRITTIATGCYKVGSFQLIINTPLALTAPTPLAVCDSDANPNNQFTTFDLTVKDAEITQGYQGYTVTYYPSYPITPSSVAIANPTAYVNVQPAIQTLGVMVTSPEGCISYTTLDIRVYPIPAAMDPSTAGPSMILSQCETVAGSGVAQFDLTTNTAYIINGNPYLVLHYFASQEDLDHNFNEILNPTAAVIGNPSLAGHSDGVVQYVYIAVQSIVVADYSGRGCYKEVRQGFIVNGTPLVNLVSNNTLNTVYVDGSNNVVQPLLLDTQLNGNYVYQWQLNGAPLPNALASAYLVATAIPGGGDSVFSVTATNINTGCFATASIVVSQSDGVPSPSGPISQTFNPGATLAYLTVTGSNVLWYDTAANKNTTSTPLPLTTLLVDGTTYYATQTVGGIESVARLPVTVHVVLGVPSDEWEGFRYAPNPVKQVLNMDSKTVLKSVAVYTLLGQKVVEQLCNNTNMTIDLSKLAAGNYILKVQSETGQKTIRIVKE